MSTANGALPFFLIDVFASTPLTGNPLALVTDADGLDGDVMRAIAREFNQSETTYLLTPSRAGADWRLRSFTAAGVEVTGAGHNALGAWWWLACAGLLDLEDGRGRFMQEIGGHVLPVEVLGANGRPALVTMCQAPPQFGSVIDDRATLATALGLGLSDLTGDLPAQVVSTGVAHLMVPAVDRDAVDRARPDAVSLVEVLRHAGAQGCYLFARDPMHRAATAYARFFNPTAGLWEDAATGSAAGPLGCFLARHGHDADAPVWIEQGHAMGRPSRIRVDLRDGRVCISGSGVVVADGTLHC